MSSVSFKVTLNDQESIKVENWDLPHFYSSLHIHPEYQISFIMKSRGTLYFGENANTFQEGDIYLIGPNVPHVFIDHQDPANVHQNVNAVTIFFPKEYVDQMFSIIKEAGQIRKLLKKSLYCVKVGETSREKVAQAINDIKGVEVGFERVLRLIYILHLISLDYEQLSSKSSTGLTHSSNRTEKVYEFTIKNYHRRIELEEVSTLVGMTVTAFCRYFKKATGKTYMQFLIEVRLGMACKIMVSDTESNLADIVHKVGFNSVTNFIKQFKKVMGETPSVYRRKLDNRINSTKHNND